jgi:hypothetical protein
VLRIANVVKKEESHDLYEILEDKIIDKDADKLDE